MAERFDAIIVGAGIVGASTALHLLYCGKKILLLDRKGAGQETSYGNAGIIGNSYVLPFDFPALNKLPGILFGQNPSASIHWRSLPGYLPFLWDLFLNSQPKARLRISTGLWPLIQKAREEHDYLAQNTDTRKYIHETGRVGIYRREESFLADSYFRQIAAERGVPFEIIDYKLFSTIEPHLQPVYHRAVRWPSSPRISDPGALIAAYVERFVKDGGFFEIANVSNLTQQHDGWHAEINSGEPIADHIVVCTGPWANDSLKTLGYHFPMAFKRGYHRHFAATGGAQLAHAIFDADGDFGLVPMARGYRLVTGVELAERDAPPTPVQLEKVLPIARELFPLGEVIDPSPWLGSRPCFADSLPVIGPAARHKNLWFNFGHSHYGITMGPASGRLMAEMMVGKATFCDPTPYRPTRFGC